MMNKSEEKQYEIKQNRVSVFGGACALDETSELVHLIRENGFDLYQTATCRDREEEEKMMEAFLFLAVVPGAKEETKETADRLGREFLYMPQTPDDEEIRTELDLLRRVLIRAKYGNGEDEFREEKIPDGALIEEEAVLEKETGSDPGLYPMKITPLSQLKKIEKQALTEVHRYLGEAPICIDHTVHPRPLGIARYLLENSFCVEKIYLDRVSPEEEKAYDWLNQNHPGLISLAGNDGAAFADRNAGQKKLALGVKAAKLEKTGFYVDMTDGCGLWGVDGRVRLLLKIKEAFLREKPPMVSTDLMRRSDAWTIEHLVPSKELMYRAGKGIFEAADWKAPVAIVCGKGNNAGDGYVVAELLKKKGIECELILLSDSFSEDGKYYYDIAVAAGVASCPYTSELDFTRYGSVLDCIFGTGFKGRVRGLAKEAIDKINSSGAYVVSADINSGLNGDTGTGSCYVRSDLTVSIGSFKYGHFRGDADLAMKEKTNIDIGIRILEE